MSETLAISKWGRLDPMLMQAWEPVLQGWATLMNQWIEYHPDEPAPWAYNKQASVGLLANAISRAYPTNLVMHEYPCVRVDENGKSHSGRADLRAEIDGLSFQLEARFLRVSCRSRNPLFSKVPEALADAKSKLTSQSDRQVYYTSAVFACPYVKSWSKRAHSLYREDCLKAKLKTKKVDAGIRADFYPAEFPEGNPDPRQMGTTIFLSFHSTTTFRVG